MADRPNILVFMTDQQRPDGLGCYGGPAETPNVDQLAEQGCRFSQAYAASPLCSPSRASFFTGRYPHSNGVYGNGVDLPEEQTTFVERLANSGYRTALHGKWHLGLPQTDTPPGFHEWLTALDHDVPPDADSDYLRYLKSEGVLPPDAEESAWRNVPDREIPIGTSPIPEEHHLTTWLADRAIEFLEDHDPTDDPFYLQVSGFYPHFPIAPPEPYNRMYDPSDIELPESRLTNGFESKPDIQTTTVAREHYERFPEQELRKAWALTYGLSTHIDNQFGRILTALEEQNLFDDTIVVYLSDHGEMLGNHGLLWKGPFMYEDILRVPLIISHPEIGSGPSDNLVSLVDLAPTLAEFGNAEHDDVDGRSLSPMLFDGRTDHRRFIYAEYLTNESTFGAESDHPIFTIRDKQFKYTVTEGQGQELYDLSEQPGEVHNHAGNPGYRSFEEKLRYELNRRRPKGE